MEDFESTMASPPAGMARPLMRVALQIELPLQGSSSRANASCQEEDDEELDELQPLDAVEDPCRAPTRSQSRIPSLSLLQQHSVWEAMIPSPRTAIASSPQNKRATWFLAASLLGLVVILALVCGPTLNSRWGRAASAEQLGRHGLGHHGAVLIKDRVSVPDDTKRAAMARALRGHHEWVNIVQSPVNVRRNKSLTSAILDQRMPGTVIVGKRDDGDWIELPHGRGYVRLSIDGTELIRNRQVSYLKAPEGVACDELGFFPITDHDACASAARVLDLWDNDTLPQDEQDMAVTRFLPKHLNGKRVLWPKRDHQFLVDNSSLGALASGSKGLYYRRSKDLSDRDPMNIAHWNMTISGKAEGDWLRVKLEAAQSDQQSCEWKDGKIVGPAELARLKLRGLGQDVHHARPVAHTRPHDHHHFHTKDTHMVKFAVAGPANIERAAASAGLTHEKFYYFAAHHGVMLTDSEGKTTSWLEFKPLVAKFPVNITVMMQAEHSSSHDTESEKGTHERKHKPRAPQKEKSHRRQDSHSDPTRKPGLICSSLSYTGGMP